MPTAVAPTPVTGLLVAANRVLARLAAVGARRRAANTLRNISAAQLRDIPEDVLTDLGIDLMEEHSGVARAMADARLMALATSARG